jgi:O-antigen/teichoic acid export membrane protein
VLSRTAEWSVSIAVPVTLVIVAFRSDLLRLFHPSYDAGAATMWLLVTAPLVNTVGGFASNALVMAGFVRWNLANTVMAVVTSFGLTWLLAPPFGFTGAAVAAAVAGVVVATLQLTEASVLMGVAPSPGSVVRPALAGTGAWVAWLIASGSRPEFGLRVASALLALLVYGALLWGSRRVALRHGVS